MGESRSPSFCDLHHEKTTASRILPQFVNESMRLSFIVLFLFHYSNSIYLRQGLTDRELHLKLVSPEGHGAGGWRISITLALFTFKEVINSSCIFDVPVGSTSSWM